MKGWHVSQHYFNKPEIRHQTGLGTSFYGAGFYITLDKNVAQYYVDLLKEDDYETPVYVYEVSIDPTSNIVDEADAEGLQLYADMMDKYENEVVTSQKMVEAGVEGIEYYSGEDGHSVVVYDPSLVKIISRNVY